MIRNVLLCISGGIAAYKIPQLIRLLRARDVSVKVVMTETAKHFVTPLIVQTLSGYPAYDTASEANDPMLHITLARWADVILVAPATANTIAKLALGIADDLLSTVVLACEAPVFVAPAMNRQMWQHSATQANLHTLRSRQAEILGPASGEQACGDVGPGRMLEPEALLSAVLGLETLKPLQGRCIMITAGPTHEKIDPIRYLSNRSSGKMGYALARAAIEMGAEVILISGPTHLTPPTNATYVAVRSAREMLSAVQKGVSRCDIFIGTAAVSDYRPVNVASHKRKKSNDDWSIRLTRNPDIIAEVAGLPEPPFCVGFSAEDHDHVQHAKDKLQRKKLDMIILNDISESFEKDTNRLTVFTKSGDAQLLERMSKQQCAYAVLEWIAKIYLSSAQPAIG